MNIEKIKNSKNQKVGKQIEYYKEIDSTHIYSQKIATNLNNDGKIVIADNQRYGVGTQRRKWYTGIDNNIAMTVILHPKNKVKNLGNLTIKIAESIQSVIKENYGYNLDIKYPNDLVIKDKKICGILTEIYTRGEMIKYLLISFGINVNEVDFSEETKDIATSLKKDFGKEFEREEIIIKIIEKLEEIEI